MDKNIRKNNRSKKGFLIGLIGTITNFLLAGTKLYIGINLVSLSVLSDSLNNFTDAIVSSTVSGSMYLTSKKKNQKYCCGFGRVEYIISFIMASIMIILGIIFVGQAIEKIFVLEIEKFNWLFIYVLIGSIFIKIILAIFYRFENKKINSSAIKTMELDSYQDIVITTVAISSLLLVRITSIRFDIVITLFIAGIIMFNGIKIIKKVYKPLVYCRYNEDDFSKKISSYILDNYKTIKCFNKFLMFDYGNLEKYATINIYFDENIDILEMQETITNLKKVLKEKFNIVLTANAITSSNKLKCDLQKMFNYENMDIEISKFQLNNNKINMDLNFPSNYEIRHKDLMKKILAVTSNKYEINFNVAY